MQKLNSRQLFPKLLYSLYFQICMSKTLRSSLNMEKYYSSSSCHWQHKKIKHTLLIWTQVHSCYDTARVSPTVADWIQFSQLHLSSKCLKQQAPPTLSRQLQTSSWNYTPNETQNIQTFGNEMSKLLIKSWTTCNA